MALASASGHGRRRVTYPRDQEEEAHPGVVSVACDEHWRGRSRGRGGEELRSPVNWALRWRREEAEATGRLAGPWGMLWWWRS